ncbi:DUF2867 domain-containing protein [Streptomyces monticola]|uniref:DUF2867 domain-containing protein n=1 Tax=Streptomyces monticola TaxID=2666263 RepID=A0ABW2JU57_9ACTN
MAGGGEQRDLQGVGRGGREGHRQEPPDPGLGVGLRLDLGDGAFRAHLGPAVEGRLDQCRAVGEGRRVRFDGAPPWDGFHELTVEPLGADRCRVRHVLEREFGAGGRLTWLLVVRPVHDTIIEELFDNIERVTTGGPARPVRRSARVRLLRRLLWARPETVAVPERARLLRAAVDRPGYTDAYRMELQPGLPRDPAAWTGILRDAFPVLAREDGELLLDVNTAGLTARASILVDERYLTLSTAVAAATLRSRPYWGVVRRAHPFMARTMLRRTHRRLALAAPSAGERARDAGTAVSRSGPGDGQSA